MTMKEWQSEVDHWIKTHGVRYFDVKTNTLLLSEELGEFSRLIARKYGEQSFKNQPSDEEIDYRIGDELADMLFVITCLANQMGISLSEVMKRNMDKKTKRDANRHHNNPKL